MADLAILEITEKVTSVRVENIFDQKHEEVFYSKENFMLFPSHYEKENKISFDVSSVTSQYGIHTPVHVSGQIYSLWVQNQNYNPIKSLATLCHAFLYHVDLDRKNTVPLIFTVPGINSEPYTVKASLRGWKNDFIYFDIVKE